MSSRDKLRKLALQSRPMDSRLIKYEDGEFEVRQPSLGLKGDITKQCGIKPGADEVDFNEWQFALLMNCIFVPGTNEKVFELGDKAAFLNQPSTGLYGELLKACNELFIDAPETAAKN